MPEVRLLRDEDAGADVLDRLHRLVLRAFDGDFAEEDWQHTATTGETERAFGALMHLSAHGWSDGSRMLWVAGAREGY